MPIEDIPEPWRSFFLELDHTAKEEVRLQGRGSEARRFSSKLWLERVRRRGQGAERCLLRNVFRESAGR